MSFSCPLIVQDPFYPGLNDVIQEHYEDKNCTPTFTKLSSLENGILKIDDSLKDCSYRLFSFSYIVFNQLIFRCHYQITDNTCNKGDWIKLNSSTAIIPQCDFLSIQCAGEYKYGHHQIYIHEEDRGRLDNDTRPNVYIFGIDGMSNQMLHRYLYKTAYWAEHEMDGINFIHYGKVSKNSIPNQFPASFGKLSYIR